MHSPPSTQWGMQWFNHDGEKNTISDWDVNAMDSDWSHIEEQGAGHDGVSSPGEKVTHFQPSSLYTHE